MLSAIATDNAGLTRTSAPVTIQVYDPAAGLPVAQIDAPASGDVITAPTMVTGTAQSAILHSWELQYQLRENPAQTWVKFAGGASSIVAGDLAAFDPTLPRPLCVSIHAPVKGRLKDSQRSQAETAFQSTPR